MVLTGVLLAIAYHKRHELLDYSIDRIVRDNIPEYVSVDDVSILEQQRQVVLRGVKVRNVPGYNEKYMLRADSVRCEYVFNGNDIRKGIVISGVYVDGPIAEVEKRGDKVNVAEIGKLMPAKEEAPALAREGGPSPMERVKKWVVSLFASSGEMLTLPDSIDVSGGEIRFYDNSRGAAGKAIIFGKVKGKIYLSANGLKQGVGIKGVDASGVLDNDPDQVVEISSSLFNVNGAQATDCSLTFKNVDIMAFKSYYDQYMPLDIWHGRVFGQVDLNTEGETIGSSGTLVIKGLKFDVKSDTRAAAYWEMGANELIAYLGSSSGEITFDFKVKGTLSEPRFYPGPRVKRALQSLVVDKVADTIRSFAKRGDAATASASGPDGQNAVEEEKSDVEKAIDMFQKLLKQ